MTTLLIMTVLLCVGAATYQWFSLRAAVRAGECRWQVLIDPRPIAAPRRLRHLSLGLWAVSLLGAGALLGLWLHG